MSDSQSTPEKVKTNQGLRRGLLISMSFLLVAIFSAILLLDDGTKPSSVATGVATVSAYSCGGNNCVPVTSSYSPEEKSVGEEGPAEAAKTGWVGESGKYQYLDESGSAVKGKMIEDQGKSYYLDEDGNLVISSSFVLDQKAWSADDSGALTPLTGWQEIDGGWYYAGTDGTLVTDSMQDKDGISVYLNEEGRMVVSDFYFNNDELYFAQEDGSVRKKAGWFEHNGKTYYSDENGKFASYEYIKVDGNYYFMERFGSRVDGTPYIDQYLGCYHLLDFMNSHFNDYFFKTPYTGLWDHLYHPEELIRPYGEFGDQGGMNCTGFLSSLVHYSGGDLDKVAEMGLEGSYGDADSYLYLGLRGYVRYAKYDSVQEYLDSGKARKGDFIYLMPSKRDDPNADCHVGVFWGDTPSENKLWSQTYANLGNITEITYKYEIGAVYVFPISGE